MTAIREIHVHQHTRRREFKLNAITVVEWLPLLFNLARAPPVLRARPHAAAVTKNGKTRDQFLRRGEKHFTGATTDMMMRPSRCRGLNGRARTRIYVYVTAAVRARSSRPYSAQRWPAGPRPENNMRCRCRLMVIFIRFMKTDNGAWCSARCLLGRCCGVNM